MPIPGGNPLAVGLPSVGEIRDLKRPLLCAYPDKPTLFCP